MTRIAAAALVLISSVGMAQEIGREISGDQPPPPPPTTPVQNFDNPYAPPPAPVPAAPAELKPAVAQEKVAGPRKGAFGLKANLGGSFVGTGTPAVGFTYLATDTVAISFDLGTGLDFSSGDFGFAVGLGIDAHLGNPNKPLRPFVAAGVGFGKPVSRSTDDFLLALNVGGGAQYWFSDHFSLNGRALLGLPVNLKQGTAAVATLTPGIGGTFYF